jgi:POT family proton-dependent oligopeptide transporter
MTNSPERTVVASPAPSSDAAKRWPPQIKFIIGNEACERFSYYGIRSILALYISQILFSTLPSGEAKDRATEIIHLFIFANYFTPLLGAWLSDKLWGRYNTILYVSLVYCLGNLVLALGTGSVWGLYIGLGLIALGSGGIKPCVSAFCGDQFKAEQSDLLQKAYGLFYWSINFGSFFSFLAIPWLKDQWGYRIAFGVPGILMLTATMIFWLGRKHYLRFKPSGDPKWYNKVLAALGFAGWIAFVIWRTQILVQNGTISARAAMFVEIGASVFPVIVWLVVATIRLHQRLAQNSSKEAGGFIVVTWYTLTSFLMHPLTRGFWDAARDKFADRSVSAAQTVPPILAVFAPICIFWSLFDQTSSTWVMQGSKMVACKIIGSFEIGAEQMQSMNPALVMILVPLMLWLYPRIEKLTGMRVSPLRRMGAGLVLGGVSYVIVGMLQTRVDAGAQLSVLWQTLPYILLTTGEVLLSTTGLEFAFTQAAAEMKSTIMSFWLLTVAFGNLFVPVLTTVKGHLLGTAGGSASVNSSTFYLYAGLTFGVAIVFTLIAMRYKERRLELTSGT